MANKNALRIGTMSEVVQPTRWLSTGNLAVDHVTGGGLPQGRSVELYGLPSSGKTTTALQAAAHLQQRIITAGLDEYILYLDFEHALDPAYATALGLDVEHRSFLLAQPGNMEQGAEAALKLTASGQVRMSVWDSVAAMAPLSRLEGEFDQRTAAMNKARLMSGLMLQLTPLLHQADSCAVFINHLMETVEMSGRPGLPPRTDTPGGRGLKYYTSLRVEYRQIRNIKGRLADPLTGESPQQAIATTVKVKCTKNKVAAPFREAEVLVRYGQGFDEAWSALQVLTAHRLVVASSTGHFYFDRDKVPALVHPKMENSASGRAYIRGENNVLAFADLFPAWRHVLITTAVSTLDTLGAPPVEDDPDADTDLSVLEVTG
jgi:recombination protein RecA